MKLTIFVPWGVAPPWWAGLVYMDRIRDGCICTLIPFNLIARATRALLWWVRYPEKSTIEEKLTRLENRNNELSRENKRMKVILGEAKQFVKEIKQDMEDEMRTISERKAT